MVESCNITLIFFFKQQQNTKIPRGKNDIHDD